MLLLSSLQARLDANGVAVDALLRRLDAVHRAAMAATQQTAEEIESIACSAAELMVEQSSLRAELRRAVAESATCADKEPT